MKKAVEGKSDFVQMAFKHFMEKMADKKAQMGGNSMEQMGGDSGEERMGGGE